MALANLIANLKILNSHCAAGMTPDAYATELGSDIFGGTVGGVTQPLSSAISANTSYTLPNAPGLVSIYIPVAYLKASSGGPFTLTLTTGVSGKTNVVVPISPSGDTISSGYLLFDVYVDSVGNVVSKAWDIVGVNTNGQYSKFAGGAMQCDGKVRGAAAGLNPYPLPAVFANTDYVVTGSVFPTGSYQFFTGYASSVSAINVYQVAGGNGFDWVATGRWR